MVYFYIAKSILGAGKIAPWVNGACLQVCQFVSCKPSALRVDRGKSPKWSPGPYVPPPSPIYTHK